MLRKGTGRASVPVDDVDRSAVEAARRDPTAFEALYRKYVAQVFNFAYYELRNRHAAEDLTAQVFLRALAGLSHFKEQQEPPGSSFKIWLLQIARNALSNERRRIRRHPDTVLDDALEVASADDPQSTVATRDQLARALDAIAALPADRRRALLLRFVDEMSTREIGQVLGRSEAATRVLIHRSLQAVGRQIGRQASRAARTRRAVN